MHSSIRHETAIHTLEGLAHEPYIANLLHVGTDISLHQFFKLRVVAIHRVGKEAEAYKVVSLAHIRPAATVVQMDIGAVAVVVACHCMAESPGAVVVVGGEGV